MTALSPKNTPGSMRRFHLNDNENYLFLTLLAKTGKTTNFDVLYNVFEDEAFLLFLDLFAGESISVPKRRELEKLVLYSRVHNFVSSRKLNETTYAHCAKVFDISKAEAEKIYHLVEDTLSTDEV